MRREHLHKHNILFVHYTSAENALKIITSKQVWMRNARCMADYMEVIHGHQMLVQFFAQSKNKDAFHKVMNRCFKDIGEETINAFDQQWNNLQWDIYISSISEHDQAEDSYGRLSMWRAFGRLPARAALVLNLPAPGSAVGLGVALSPVAYLDYNGVEKLMKKIIANVRSNVDFLRTLDRERVKASIFEMLSVTAVSLKHVGFKEEKEWRVIYMPQVRPSNLITWATEVVEGIPQVVHKIPLTDRPDNDLVGVEIPALVERVIIGPTAFPVTIGHAFMIALTQAGVPNAASRVMVSSIPLRQ